MGNEVDIAVGVVNGKVVAKWHRATAEIVFDPNNAYQIGKALSNAACDAAGTTPLMMGDTGKMRITMEQRARILIIAGKLLRSMTEQGKHPEQIAVHVVDFVLQETTE